MDDRKLISYLPPVLRDVLEFQVINDACEPEIQAAWDVMNQLLANQFLETATDLGLRLWEQELGITAMATDPLELRRDRIRARWDMRLPYTIRWLGIWLTGIYGEASHEEYVEDYTLSVGLNYDGVPGASSLTEDLMAMLRTLVPANMAINIEISSTENATAYAFAATLGTEIRDSATAVIY